MSAVPLALVTGLTGQLDSAGAALGRAGFDVVTWDTTEATPPAPDRCGVRLLRAAAL